MQEGLTQNLSAFSCFLEIASFSQGQVLNMSAIARETNINQKNVSNYFDILDMGVYQTLRPKGIIDTSAAIEGAAYEI